MKPLQNFVLLEPIEEKVEGGIILPDKIDVEPTNQAKVIGCGEAVKLPIKVGDTVLFKVHLFDALEVENKKFHLIGREEGIFAKL